MLKSTREIICVHITENQLRGKFFWQQQKFASPEIIFFTMFSFMEKQSKFVTNIIYSKKNPMGGQNISITFLSDSSSKRCV